MFVQISPNAADVGETLCSLNFASRVRGIESGPARKQVDLNELFKYKQMVCVNKSSFDEVNFFVVSSCCISDFQINRQKSSSMMRRRQRNYRRTCSLCS